MLRSTRIQPNPSTTSFFWGSELGAKRFFDDKVATFGSRTKPLVDQNCDQGLAARVVGQLETSRRIRIRQKFRGGQMVARSRHVLVSKATVCGYALQPAAGNKLVDPRAALLPSKDHLDSPSSIGMSARD